MSKAVDLDRHPDLLEEVRAARGWCRSNPINAMNRILVFALQLMVLAFLGLRGSLNFRAREPATGKAWMSPSSPSSTWRAQV